MKEKLHVGQEVMIVNYDVHFDGLIVEIVMIEDGLYTVCHDGITLRDLHRDELGLFEDDLK